MKLMLLPHVPAQEKSHAEQLADIVDTGVLAEQLGFDYFGVGERHDRPSVTSAPPVVLAALAARTSTIRLITAVTTLGALAPLRAYEDYATLDNLSDGRLDLIIGKGAYPRSAELFGLDRENTWRRLQRNYEVFRQLWEKPSVTFTDDEGRGHTDVEALPRPLQENLRVWHGSATSRDSADFAARHGEPLFSSNGSGPPGPFAALVAHYRERFAHHGHDPKDALVAIGTAGYFGARTSQEAVARYRAAFEYRLNLNRTFDGGSIAYDDVDTWIAESSVLVGSPQQIIEKVHAQHEIFGHELFHVHVDRETLTERDYRATLDLFATEIVPVLRRELPSRALTSGVRP